MLILELLVVLWRKVVIEAWNVVRNKVSYKYLNTSYWVHLNNFWNIRFRMRNVCTEEMNHSEHPNNAQNLYWRTRMKKSPRFGNAALILPLEGTKPAGFVVNWNSSSSFCLPVQFLFTYSTNNKNISGYLFVFVCR